MRSCPSIDATFCFPFYIIPFHISSHVFARLLTYTIGIYLYLPIHVLIPSCPFVLWSWTFKLVSGMQSLQMFYWKRGFDEPKVGTAYRWHNIGRGSSNQAFDFAQALLAESLLFLACKTKSFKNCLPAPSFQLRGNYFQNLPRRLPGIPNVLRNTLPNG